ncbi:MAG: hypothetical protein JRI23_17320 [Deltaproteobacteria bacterium]|jgi:hypothetical protein|nr:hypothetical protein [Deltaproteobacteria bacterium]MBW2533579.1 hypothetical protein [Deltaproteobacteria bacterium]
MKHALDGLDVRAALEFALTTEATAAQYYEELAARFAGHKALSELFTGLREDEERHEALIRRMLENAPAPSSKGVGAMLGYLGGLARRHFLSSVGNVSEAVAAIGSAEDGLAKVVEIERQTLEFYQALRTGVGEHPDLDLLIHAEEAHLEMCKRSQGRPGE